MPQSHEDSKEAQKGRGGILFFIRRWTPMNAQGFGLAARKHKDRGRGGLPQSHEDSKEAQEGIGTAEGSHHGDLSAVADSEDTEGGGPGGAG